MLLMDRSFRLLNGRKPQVEAAAIPHFYLLITKVLEREQKFVHAVLLFVRYIKQARTRNSLIS